MQAATLTAVVVFPTPPFWFAIANTVLIANPKLASRAAGSGRQRALCGHSRPPWIALRRGRDLAEDVQRAALGARVRLDRQHPVALEAERLRRRQPVRLLHRVDRALPRDQQAAFAQQRRG